MNCNSLKSFFRLWFYDVSRGYSLLMSVMPWLVAFLYCLKQGGNILYGMLALIGIVAAHLGTNVFDDVVDKLKSIGYIHEGNLGIEDREAFKYLDKPHLQTHHLYVCPQQSKELHRHITFRDFLRKNPEAVKKYGAVKEMAAQLFPDDIEKYIEYKSPCIEELYKICGLK